jgi:2-keto-4-pentenoate hydratase/2-oxohepta-3-ene-1,7-dioic acid hydratase in catechol pathway
MKLVTYLAPATTPRLGVVVNELIYDLAGMAQACGEVLPSNMLDFLTLGAVGMERAQKLLARISVAGWPGIAQSAVQILAPIPRPPKVLALAGNFQEHIKEGGGQAVNKERITPRPFIKPSSCVIGPHQPVFLQKATQTTDWELELLIVIGRAGRYIKVEEALSYVAGYTIFNDISARTLEITKGRDERNGDWYFDWLLGKWLDSYGPMGPYLVTTDEIPDPHNLAMKLYVNGKLMQDGNTSQMIFNVPETVSFISQFITLEPGDVIASGTPSGVGATTGTYLKVGDVMRGEIEQLGSLVTPVQDEA